MFTFDGRLSDSPLVEMIWRTHSERTGSFISQAASRWEMVVMKHQGKTILTVRGPETRATIADVHLVDAEFFGIVFRPGAFMPHLPPGASWIATMEPAGAVAQSSGCMAPHGSIPTLKMPIPLSSGSCASCWCTTLSSCRAPEA
jgi:hypothetical protein